jgi:hypothetical protein
MTSSHYWFIFNFLGANLGEALVGQPQVIGFSSRYYYLIRVCYILPEINANILVRLIDFSV